MNSEDQLIEGFRDLYNKLVWLNQKRMKNSFQDYKSSEVHCLEYINNNPDSNVTKLAESFYMTNGAISKLTKKLLDKGVIESYQKPDNKKEIYFRLTEQGKAIYRIHENLHKEFRERDKPVFDLVTQQQLEDMLRFVDRYRDHLDKEIAKAEIDGEPM